MMRTLTRPLAHSPRHLRWLPPLLISVVLAGCGLHHQVEKSREKIAAGQSKEGLAELEALASRHPEAPSVRAIAIREREQQIAQLLTLADGALVGQRFDQADGQYREVLALDPHNQRALMALAELPRHRAHAAWLLQAKEELTKGNSDQAERLIKRLLAESPQHAGARALLQTIEDQRQRAESPVEAGADINTPVDLEFRNAPFNMVLEGLSKTSELNFVLDRDVRPDLRTTILVHQMPLLEALDLVLKTNQLEKKVVNPTTFLIYPSNPTKQKEYQELMVKTFYLGNSEAKTTVNLLKTLLKINDIHVDEKLNALVVRDTPDTIAVAEKIIRSQDLAEPEVLLEVEVLEISRDSLLQLGIQPPDQISASLVGSNNATPGVLRLDELKNLNKSNVLIGTPNPAVLVNLKRTKGATNTLANPRIRVQNREKAKIHIGDKVPVITTNTNQSTGTTISESVSYLDVGLKLEVEPQVYLDNEIAIKVNLEVNNVVKEVASKTGLLTYQVGTRATNTTLRLKDGETQVLAGLIKHEDSNTVAGLPGLADIPLLGRFFSSHKNSRNNTEIVLLITPRVVRNLDLPPSYDTEFLSGTGNSVSLSRAKTAPAAAATPTKTDAASKPAPAATKAASAEATESSAANAAPPAQAAPAATPNTETAPAQVQLKLLPPERVNAGQFFQVMVTQAHAEAPESLSLELQFNAEYIELMDARLAGSLAPSLARLSRKDEQAGRVMFTISFTQPPTPESPLLSLSFRARKASEQPVFLGISSLSATKAKGEALTVKGSEPVAIKIAP